VSVLEWLLIVELLLLLSAGVCYMAGRITSRSSGDEDPLYRTFTRFWEVFLTPQPSRYAVPDVVGDWIEEQRLAEGEAEAAESLEGLEESVRGGRSARRGSAAAREMEEEAEESDQAATVVIRVVPNSGRSAVVDRSKDEVVVELAVADEHGQANKALIELLSQRLGVKTYQIQLVRGHYRAVKTVRIMGVEQSEADGKLSGVA
jgi:uncharacterized protein YggU (UPF0235/DUF167 family)